MTNPINVACIVLMSPSLFIIFDGPGMLSPTIPVNNSSNTTVCFSGFLGYIVYSTETNYSFTDKKHTLSDVSKTITWYTRKNNGNKKLCSRICQEWIVSFFTETSDRQQQLCVDIQCWLTITSHSTLDIQRTQYDFRFCVLFHMPIWRFICAV